MMLALYRKSCTSPQAVAHLRAYHATNTESEASYTYALLQSGLTPHEHVVLTVLSEMDAAQLGFAHPPIIVKHESLPT